MKIRKISNTFGLRIGSGGVKNFGKIRKEDSSDAIQSDVKFAKFSNSQKNDKIIMKMKIGKFSQRWPSLPTLLASRWKYFLLSIYFIAEKKIKYVNKLIILIYKD